jgi:hypothetical protein
MNIENIFPCQRMSLTCNCTLNIYFQYGKNTLGNMLKTICKQSGLNDIYTNHSLRATSITVLDFNKFGARDIMAVSGHRSESSLKNYRKKPSKTRIHEMSTVLLLLVSVQLFVLISCNSQFINSGIKVLIL